MLILGIETSCDETSAAVVEDGRTVRSNVVSSQVQLHTAFGGVVPEIASREHVRAMTPVTRRALAEAGVGAAELDAVAATVGPGLAGALLVGASFGRAFALGLRVPFLPVNHIEGHLHSVWLAHPDNLHPDPELPMLVLVVSGGHTELILMHGHGRYQPVGRTLDDAAGEAFDKVARILGLSYPGGPAIQAAALSADAELHLPRAWLPGSFDFSFSGLKTATLHAAWEAAVGGKREELRGRSLPSADVASLLTAQQVSNLAAGFQESAVDVLVTKTATAAQELGSASVAVVGGVAANARLRQRMRECIPLPLYIPPVQYSTDNAAMIAAAGHFVRSDGSDVDIRPNLRLAGL